MEMEASGDPMLILEFGLGPAVQDSVNVSIDISSASSNSNSGSGSSEGAEFEGGRKHIPIPWQVAVSSDGSLVAVLMSTMLQVLPYSATSQTRALAQAALEPTLAEDLRHRDLCWSRDSNYIVALSGFGHVYIYSSLCALLCRLTPHDWIEGSSLSTCVKVVPVDVDGSVDAEDNIYMLAIFATGDVAFVRVTLSQQKENNSNDNYSVKVLAKVSAIAQARARSGGVRQGVEHVVWCDSQRCLVVSCLSVAESRRPILSMIGLGAADSPEVIRSVVLIDVIAQEEDKWALRLRPRSLELILPTTEDGSVSESSNTHQAARSWIFGGASDAHKIRGAIVRSVVVEMSGVIVIMLHTGGFVTVVDLGSLPNEGPCVHIFSIRQVLQSVRSSDIFSGLDIVKVSSDNGSMTISVTNQRGEIRLLMLKKTPNTFILEPLSDVYCLPPVIGPSASSCGGLSLATSSHIAFLRALNPSTSQIFRMNAVAPESVLERHIIKREYAEAYDLAKRCNLDPDIVYIKQWRRATDYVMGRSKLGRDAYKAAIVDTRDVVEKTLEKALLSSAFTEMQRTWDVATEDALNALRHVASESKFIDEITNFRCGALHGDEGAGRLRFWKHVLNEGCIRLQSDVKYLIINIQRKLSSTTPLSSADLLSSIESFVGDEEFGIRPASAFYGVADESAGGISLTDAVLSILSSRLRFSEQLLRFHALDFLVASRSISIIPNSQGISVLCVAPRSGSNLSTGAKSILVEDFIRDDGSQGTLLQLARELAREAYIDELSFLMRIFGASLRNHWLSILSSIPISVTPDILFSVLPMQTFSNSRSFVGLSADVSSNGMSEYPDAAVISSLDIITASGEVSESFYVRLLHYFDREPENNGDNSEEHFDHEKLLQWYINRAMLADAFGLTYVAQLWVDCAIPRLFYSEDLQKCGLSTQFSRSATLGEIDLPSFEAAFPSMDFPPHTESRKLALLFILELRLHLFHFNSLLLNGYICELSEFKSWCLTSPRRRILQVIQSHFARVGCVAKEGLYSEHEVQALSLVIHNAIRPLSEGSIKLYQYLSPDAFAHMLRPYTISHYDTFAKDCSFAEAGPIALVDSESIKWVDLVGKAALGKYEQTVNKYYVAEENVYQWKRDFVTSLGALGEEMQIDGGGIVDFNWERFVVHDLIEIIGEISDQEKKFKALLVISEIVDVSAPTVSVQSRCLSDYLALISLVTKTCLTYDDTSNPEALNVLWGMVEKTPTSSASMKFKKTDANDKSAEREFKHLLTLLDSVQESLSACDIIRKRGLTPPPLSMLLKVGNRTSSVRKQQKYLKEYLLSSRFIADGLDDLVHVFPVNMSPPRKSASQVPEAVPDAQTGAHVNKVQSAIYMGLISKVVLKFENKSSKNISNLMNGMSGAATSQDENEWTSLGKDVLELLMLRSTYLSNKDVSSVWIGNMLLQGILHSNQIAVFQSAISSIVSARESPTFLGSIIAELGVTRGQVQNLVVRRTASIFEAASSCSDPSLAVAYKYLKLFSTDQSKLSLTNTEDFVKLQAFADVVSVFSLAESHMIPLQMKMADPNSVLCHLLRECPAVFIAVDSGLHSDDSTSARYVPKSAFETSDKDADSEEPVPSEDSLVKAFMLRSRPCPGQRLVEVFSRFFFADVPLSAASRYEFEIEAKCEFIRALKRFSHKRLDLSYRVCYSLIEKNLGEVNSLLENESLPLQERSRMCSAISKAHVAVCDAVNELKAAAESDRRVIVDERPIEELLNNIANAYVLVSMPDQLHEAIGMFEDILPNASGEISNKIDFAHESMAAILNEALGSGVSADMESIDAVRSAGACNQSMDVIGSLITISRPDSDSADVDGYSFFDHISTDLMKKLANASKGGVMKSSKAPASRIVEIDENLVKQLQSMGFSYNGAKRAVMATNSTSKANALRWAIEHSNDSDFDEPVVVSMGNKEASGVSKEPVLKLSGSEPSMEDASKLKRALEYVNQMSEAYASMVGAKEDPKPTEIPEVFSVEPPRAPTPPIVDDDGGDDEEDESKSATIIPEAIAVSSSSEEQKLEPDVRVEPVPVNIPNDIDFSSDFGTASPCGTSGEPVAGEAIEEQVVKPPASIPAVAIEQCSDTTAEIPLDINSHVVTAEAVEFDIKPPVVAEDALPLPPTLHIQVPSSALEDVSTVEPLDTAAWEDDFEIESDSQSETDADEDQVVDIQDSEEARIEEEEVSQADKITPVSSELSVCEPVALADIEDVEFSPQQTIADSDVTSDAAVNTVAKLGVDVNCNDNSATVDQAELLPLSVAQEVVNVSPTVSNSNSANIKIHLVKTNDAERLQEVLERCMSYLDVQLDAERMSHATIFSWSRVDDLLSADMAPLWGDYSSLLRDLAASPRREAFESTHDLIKALMATPTLAPVATGILDTLSQLIRQYCDELELIAPPESDQAAINGIVAPNCLHPTPGFDSIDWMLSKLRLCAYLTRAPKQIGDDVYMDDDEIIVDEAAADFDIESTAIPVLLTYPQLYLELLSSLFALVDPSSFDAIEFLQKCASDVVNSSDLSSEDAKRLKADLAEASALVKRLSRIPGVKGSSVNIKNILLADGLFPTSIVGKEAAWLSEKRAAAIYEVLMLPSSFSVETVVDSLYLPPSKQLEVLNVWVRAVGRHLDVTLSELAFHRACQLLCLTKFYEPSVEVAGDNVALIISGMFKKMKPEHSKDICGIIACCLDVNDTSNYVSGIIPMFSWDGSDGRDAWRMWRGASQYILLHILRRISSDGDGTQIAASAPAKPKTKVSLLQKSNTESAESQLDLSAYLKELLEFVSNGSSLVPDDLFAAEFGSFYSVEKLYRTLKSCYNLGNVTNEALRSIKSFYLARMSRIIETHPTEHPIWAPLQQSYGHFIQMESSKIAVRLDGMLALNYCDEHVFVPGIRAVTELYQNYLQAFERILCVSSPELHRDIFQFAVDRIEAMSFDGCDSEELPSGRFQRAHCIVSVLKSVLTVNNYDLFGGAMERLLQWTTVLTYFGRIVEIIEIIPKSVSIASAMASHDSFCALLLQATGTYLRSSKVDILKIDFILRSCMSIFRTISGYRLRCVVSNSLADFHSHAFSSFKLVDPLDAAAGTSRMHSASMVGSIIQLLEVCGLCSDICPGLETFVAEVFIVDLRIWSRDQDGVALEFNNGISAAVKSDLSGHSVSISMGNVLRPLSRALKVALLILAGDLILPGDELIPKLVAETEGTLSEFSQSVLLLAIVSKLEPSVWCKDPKLTQFVVRSSLEHWNRWIRSSMRLENYRSSQALSNYAGSSAQLTHVYATDYAPVLSLSLSDALQSTWMRPSELQTTLEPPLLCSLCCPVSVAILMTSSGYILEAAQLYYSFAQLPRAMYRADFAIAAWRQFLGKTAVSGVILLNGKVDVNALVGFDDVPSICRTLLQRLEMQNMHL